jgi:hypothetical protein
MDIKPILIILLLLFSAFGGNLDLTNLDFLPIMNRVEIIQPEERFTEFSKDIAGTINYSDRSELALFFDVFSENLLTVKNSKPKISTLIECFNGSFSELYDKKYNDVYKNLSTIVISIFKQYSEENDRMLSSEEIQELAFYFKGLAWNIKTP